MKCFLEEHGLRLQDPSSAVLPPALRGQILVLVQESLGICRDLLRVGKRRMPGVGPALLGADVCMRVDLGHDTPAACIASPFSSPSCKVLCRRRLSTFCWYHSLAMVASCLQRGWT